MSKIEEVYCRVEQFVAGSAAGLVQLLVATATRKTFNRIIACPTYPVPVRSSDLATAVLELREVLECQEVHVPTLLARLYASARSLEHRKRSGQFFTAPEVADWAMSFCTPNRSDMVCDAGAGTGVFANAVLRGKVRPHSYVGVENDPILALCAAHVLEALGAPESFKIWYANFLLLKPNDFSLRGLQRPSFVIANPPFVRFHNLSSRARIRKDIRLSLGVTLSSYSGSGNYFLSRAAEIAHSTPNGNGQGCRLLFFLPNEAAGAEHAKRLRNDLEKLHGWHYKQVRIPQLQTGIDRHPSNALGLLFAFQQQQDRPSFIPPPVSHVNVLRELLRIKRGISTGCNDFFVLTEREVKEKKIPRRYLRPVLPTRIPITSNQILQADWELLRRSDHACWLLALPPKEIEEFEPQVREYLDDGLRRGLHETPTSTSFKKWFSIPIPDSPPDIFITYLFRSSPRFVLNRAQLLHLTNILGARFVFPVADEKRQEMIVESLNELAHSWMKDGNPGREYKGGLLKIEPGELSELPIDSKVLKLASSKALVRKAIPQSLFG